MVEKAYACGIHVHVWFVTTPLCGAFELAVATSGGIVRVVGTRESGPFRFSPQRQ